MKTLRLMLAAYLPMPHELVQAIESGTVRTICDENGDTVYFIAPSCTQIGSVRRAIAKRRRWELAAVCGFGLAIGTALAGVAHFLSI